MRLVPARPQRTHHLDHLRRVGIGIQFEMRAQRRLWSLQGQGNIWWAGAYFGSGFHEDALQSGLAVAEDMGAPRRPWNVPDESGRIHLPAAAGGN